MAECVICQEFPAEDGMLVDGRCGGRVASALRQIPKLVDELHGLGYVERDVRPERCSTPACFARGEPVDVIGTVRRGREALEYGVRLCVECAARLKAAGVLAAHVAIPARPADPVANGLTAGPTKSTWSESRIRSTRPERLPIAVDPTDLLMPARAGSVAVHAGPYAADQVGHLSVATVLDFWCRDWADLRGEGLPPLRTARERSPAGLLARWLSDRLDWALQHHPALDEFAHDVSDLLGALFGAVNGGRVVPKPMEADCPRCGWAALFQPFSEADIECGNPDCRRVLSPAEYAEHVRTLIDEAAGSV